MTVGQLIERLKDYPPGMKLRFHAAGAPNLNAILSAYCFDGQTLEVDLASIAPGVDPAANAH